MNDTGAVYKSFKLPFRNTRQFPELFLQYVENTSQFADFIAQSPSTQGIIEAANTRKFAPNHRQILACELNKQYQHLANNQTCIENIKKLTLANTYTITTGHQICLMTGPLYFIYKIITTIKLCQTLNSAYPQYHFVPIYWMATEDHDKAEINRFSIFGKKYTFDTPEEGAVGQFNTAHYHTQLQLLPKEFAIFYNFYLSSKNLAEATQKLLHSLFGEYGLIVLEPNNTALKQLFTPIVINELQNQTSAGALQKYSTLLHQMGYKPQVHAREINLFYLQKNSRQRIVFENGKYTVQHTPHSYTLHEILKIADKNPENFSPNVVLRPVYQETILPNVAYVGGPGELSYWLQLKGVFEAFTIPMPVLVPRNSAMIISKTNHKKLQQLQIEVNEIFEPLHVLKEKILQRSGTFDFDSEKYKAQITHLFDEMIQLAMKTEKNIAGNIEAKKHETHKAIDDIHKRLLKEIKKKQENNLSKIDHLYSKLFPDNELQERTDNILNFLLNNKNIIANLLQLFDPFDYRFQLIIIENNTD